MKSAIYFISEQVRIIVDCFSYKAGSSIKSIQHSILVGIYNLINHSCSE